MKITIEPQNDTSITQETEPFVIEKYTIFAGENNAGKSHLIRAIMAKIGDQNTIFIPAEKIDANEQMKVSAAGDPMRNAISKLINITVESMPTIDCEAVTTLFESIESTFNSFCIVGAKLKLEQKEFAKAEVKKAIHDSIAQKILDAKILDTYKSETEPLELKIASASQGTQRLIIASVIQELGKIHTNSGQEEMVILFEEPEIYLHPRLKKSLYDALYTLSKNGIKIVISTHDPYFIELGGGHKIYEVYRNREKDYSTDVKEITGNSILGYKSDAEINHRIFGIISKTYFLELYECLKGVCREKGLIGKNEYQELNEWLKNNDARIVNENNPKLSKIRHALAHPNKGAVGLEIEQKDIDEIVQFIQKARCSEEGG